MPESGVRIGGGDSSVLNETHGPTGEPKSRLTDGLLDCSTTESGSSSAGLLCLPCGDSSSVFLLCFHRAGERGPLPNPRGCDGDPGPAACGH